MSEKEKKELKFKKLTYQLAKEYEKVTRVHEILVCVSFCVFITCCIGSTGRGQVPHPSGGSGKWAWHILSVFEF